MGNYCNASPGNTAEISHCKVPGCKETHSKHFCKTCKNPNSDHFSTNCSLTNKNNQTKNKQKSSNISQNHCLIPGCPDKHAKHFCKSCQNVDSDHFSSDCPNNKFKKSARINCKVPGCITAHDSHYCRFCEDKNSDHFAKDCPESQDLFHATNVDYLEIDNGIREIGLVPRNNGNRFGMGIYFADKDVVEDVRDCLFGYEKGALLKCRVWLGKCKDYKKDVDRAGTWANDYDSCTAIHPPWFEKASNKDFQEYVIKNQKKVRIYSITFKKQEFRMYDFVKDKEVLEKIKNGMI